VYDKRVRVVSTIFSKGYSIKIGGRNQPNGLGGLENQPNGLEGLQNHSMGLG